MRDEMQRADKMIIHIPKSASHSHLSHSLLFLGPEGEYSAADDAIADVCLNKKQNNDEGWATFSMLMDLTDTPVCQPLPTTLWEIHWNDI